VLDVAAGNGNATLAAARRGARVTSTDYVSTLLDRGATRAQAEGLDVRFQIADAEALPFESASFDAVLSTFGVMFAPDHAAAASEMTRVCRPGGRIGLANWTPEGFVGRAFGALSAGQGAELERDLTELLDRLNRAGPGSLVVPSEYLEVVATRR